MLLLRVPLIKESLKVGVTFCYKNGGGLNAGDSFNTMFTKYCQHLHFFLK